MVELAVAALGVAMPVAGGSAPSPLWRGADRIVLSCSADAAASAALGADWCRLVLAEAQRGARIPVVDAIGAGSDRSALTLRVAVAEGAIALTVERALSIDDSEGVVRRRGPALPPGEARDPQVGAAFAAALDTVLPWRRAASSPGMRSRRLATPL